MNVLSLFDGMSCGQQALQRAGFEVTQYFASEIDKHAIKTTMANFPNTVQLGSVVGVDGYSLPKIDLLIGGSPCQSFSFAGKRKGMATKDEQEILTLEHYLRLKGEGFEFEGQSYLFWEYMRLLNECRTKNQNVCFLLENVEMGEKWETVLSRAIGVKGIHINSALISAQNRKRIYWTNIGLAPSGLFGDLESIIQQPKDKGILLKDILESDVDEKYFLSEKSIVGILKHKKEQEEKGFGFGAVIKNEDEKMNSLKIGGKGVDDLIVHNTMPRSGDPKKGGTGHLSRSDGKTYCLDTGNTNAVEIYNNKRLNETIEKHKENLEHGTLIDSYNQEIHNDKSITISTRVNASSCTHIVDTNAVEIVAMRGRENTAILTPKRTEFGNAIRKEYENGTIETQRKNIQQLEPRNDGKTNCLTSVQKDNLVREVKQISTNNKSNGGTQPYQQDRIYDVNGISPALQSQLCTGSTMINTSRIRRLTPIECERLQTVKDNYTNHVSDSQRYKMIGNGWTVDVIVHILNYLKTQKK